jgi:hypothetical protein
MNRKDSPFLKMLILAATLILFGLGVFLAIAVFQSSSNAKVTTGRINSDATITTPENIPDTTVTTDQSNPDTTKTTSQKIPDEKNLGSLQRFSYDYGMHEEGYCSFTIEKNGDDYLFTAKGTRPDRIEFNTEKMVDQSVPEDLKNILYDEKLYSRNGENIREDNVFDGWSEDFTAIYETQTIEFHYYGGNNGRNKVLRDYLYALTDQKDQGEGQYTGLQELHYSYGSFFEGTWGFDIVRDEDAFQFSAFNGTVNGEPLSTSMTIEKNTMAEIEKIIFEEKIYLRNGETPPAGIFDELMDGSSENLTAKYETGTIEYSYYGSDGDQNMALRKYLMELSGLSEEPAGPPVAMVDTEN